MITVFKLRCYKDNHLKFYMYVSAGRQLSGPDSPEDWHGRLDATYNIGGNFTDENM